MLPAAVEQSEQRLRLDRLGEVMIEARRTRLEPCPRPAPSLLSLSTERRCLRAQRESCARLRIHWPCGMPMSSSATSGRRARETAQRRAAIVRELHIVTFEPEDDRKAFGGIAIVVGEQDALVGRAAAVRRARCAGARGTGCRRIRQTHGEAAALALCPRSARSMRPPCSSTMPFASARPIPRPPAACPVRNAPARTCRRPSADRSGAMPMPLSSTLIDQLVAIAAARRTRIVPPGSVYFAALVSRFDSTCARRSGSRIDCRSSGTSTTS